MYLLVFYSVCIFLQYSSCSQVLSHFHVHLLKFLHTHSSTNMKIPGMDKNSNHSTLSGTGVVKSYPQPPRILSANFPPFCYCHAQEVNPTILLSLFSFLISLKMSSTLIQQKAYKQHSKPHKKKRPAVKRCQLSV